MHRTLLLIGAALALATPSLAERTPAPAGATAYIVSPPDGATVQSPVAVVFGLRNLGVAPAGIQAENTGHHHLLIDVDLNTLDFEGPLPATEQIRHFGGGQTETTLELPPGAYRLQLLVGDHNHIPHEPPIYSEAITVIVD